jgi:hypothetical protein
MPSDRANILIERQKALSFLANRSFKEAEPYLREACEQTKTQHNAETFHWQERLVHCLMGLSKWTEAEALAKKTANQFRLAFGQDDEDVFDCEYLQAACFHGAGKNSSAEDIARTALQGLEKSSRRGVDHPTTLCCRGLLACVLKGLGRIKDAKELVHINEEYIAAVQMKAEATEAQGSRKLAYSERDALHKAEELNHKVTGEKLKPKHTATIETVSTQEPESGMCSEASSRVASKVSQP